LAYDWQGRLRTWGTEAKVNLAMPRETYVSIGYGIGFERIFEEDFGIRRSAETEGSFIGEPYRAARNRTFSFYGESSITPRLFVSGAASYKQGELDLDYDAGPLFLRVSPLALDDPDAPLDPQPGGLLYLETSFAYQTTDALRIAFDYSKYRLARYDNGRVAFDDNTYSGRVNYQFTKDVGMRAIFDYSSLTLRLRSQMVFAVNHPTGRSLYLVYSDDHARSGYGPFFGSLAPDFRTNGRTFLIRVVYPVFTNSGGRIP
jgi:hypothetical protein